MNVNIYTEQVQNWIKEISLGNLQDPNAIVALCDELEDYGKRIEDDALIGYARFSRGEAYYAMYDVKNFYQQMFGCIGPMERIEEWGYVAMANNLIGIIFLDSGNAPLAIDYFQRALGICEKYQLPDLECVVRINIGNLYLSIGENEQALAYFKRVYYYTLKQQELDHSVQNLTSIHLQMAKAYLHLGMEKDAQTYLEKIEDLYLPQATELEKFVVNCFACVFYFQTDQMREFHKHVGFISEEQVKFAPIMDVYDDLYDYLDVLLRAEEYQQFDRIYKQMKTLAHQTTIKNLEKRLLHLELQYDKRLDKIDDYKDAAVKYYEITEEMEQENRAMMSNVVKMRTSFNSLEEKNKEVTRRNKDLRIKSETDALTGIYNRAKFTEYSAKAFREAKEHATSIAVEILDIDYFKQYNDNYGHQAGDAAIKAVAEQMLDLEQENRDTVFCARYGGDEFVIIYENLSQHEVEALANRLKRSIETQGIAHQFSLAEKYLTISQGICWGIPGKNETMDAYLKKADQLLYEVKEVSRNSVRIGQLKG